MIGIMCDQDVQGLARAVLAHCRQSAWKDIWNDLEIELYTFAELALEPDATDADIWSACQKNNIVLLTGNRNAEGPDSLEVTIREHNTTGSLPVLTFADLSKPLDPPYDNDFDRERPHREGTFSN